MSAEPSPGFSLERQLKHRLVLLVSSVLLVVGVLGYMHQRLEINEILDGSLEETAERMLALPAPMTMSSQPLSTYELSREQLIDTDEQVMFQLFDARGNLVLRSHEAPAAAFAPKAPEGLSQHPPYRVFTLTAADGRRAQVAEIAAHRSEAVWASTAWLVISGIALGPLLAWAISVLLRRGFRTLEPARQSLQNRSSADLRPVPLDGTPRELHALLATVNELLQRQQALLAAERGFAARVAHELRTPLAAARAQAQRLGHELPADAYAATQHTQALVRQLDRLTQLATRLTHLARIESGVALARQPVDLGLMSRLVVEEFAEARPGGRLSLSRSAPAMVEGDVDALGIALRNLIDNALKHGGPQSPVRVTVRPGEIEVEDDGPGVGSAVLSDLLRPFERGTSSAEGAGLGLSMVQTVAQQSGAELVLQSPVSDGRGFRAVLRFNPAGAVPAAATEPQTSVTRANLRLPT